MHNIETLHNRTVEQKLPRIMIAGTSSGSGKTTVTCAVLQLLMNQGGAVTSFKCGPDYIDPMFHEQIIGNKSYNLDGFFCEEQLLCSLFGRNASDCSIAVIEGVMGFFDGCGIGSTKASAYDVARITGTPVILVVNCKGMAQSVLAVIKGYLELYADTGIKGIILNQITEQTYVQLKPAIETMFAGKVQVAGYLPKLPKELVLESRHLGLVTAGEIADLKDKMQELAELATKTIDLDLVKAMAKQAAPLVYEDVFAQELQRIQQAFNKKGLQDRHPRIAIAKDAAFCFYYRENLELLELLGAELVEFSPMADAELPSCVDGLYLGGGYPELWKEVLSANKTMLQSVRMHLQEKLPCIAECGGFLYLQKEIDGAGMAGVLAGTASNAGKLQHFGYITMTAKKSNLLCRRGEQLKAHEFHYYHSTNLGSDFTAEKSNGKQWNCVIAEPHLYAGFPHLYFPANMEALQHFYEGCCAYQQHRNGAGKDEN